MRYKIQNLIYHDGFSNVVPADDVGLVGKGIVWRVYLSLALPATEDLLVALGPADVFSVRLNKV